MTTITGLRTVGVPVTDQDRALAFYRALGFETRLDAPINETMRWIEVAPPGSTSSLALLSGSDVEPGIDTGVRFSVASADLEHREMATGGVSVGEVLRWDGVPPMFTFTDPDGNVFYVVEEMGPATSPNPER